MSCKNTAGVAVIDLNIGYHRGLQEKLVKNSKTAATTKKENVDNENNL
jgi:hypothetical protein